MGLSSSETNLRASEIRDHPLMEGTTIRVLDNSQMTVAFDDGSHLDVSE